MDPTKNSRDQKFLGAEEKEVAAFTYRGRILRDIFMSDKPTLRYAGLHQETTRNLDYNVPKSLEKQPSQVRDRKAIKKDELVRYMSKLPSYLEKGKNIQEKTLNVGVRDWGSLEKLQGNGSLMPQKNSGYSPASGSSSFFSTDGSSTLSNRGPSCSPAHRRLHHLPLQSHLEASPQQNYRQDVKPYSVTFNARSPAHQSICGQIPHSHHPKAYPWEGSSQHSLQRKLFGTDQRKIQSEIRLERCDRKGSVSKSGLEMGKRVAVGNYEVASFLGRKMKTHDQGSAMAVVGLQECNCNFSGQQCSQRNKTAVHILPRDRSQNSCSGVARSSESSAVNACIPTEPGWTSLSETTNSKEVHSSNLCSDISQSCPLPARGEIEKLADTRELYSIEGHSTKVSSRPLHKMPHSAKTISSPYRIKKGEEKQPIPMLKSSSAIKPSLELDIRTASDSSTKSRNPSPIRRLGLGMARIIRNASSRENSPQRKSVSKVFSSKPMSEGAAASVPLDSLSNSKLHSNNRARSSPLRRLLDPLLKPKGPHCLHNTEQLKKDSTSTVGPCKSSEERYNFPNLQSVKVKSGVDGNRTSNNNGSYQKCGSSSFQALLQVAVKNGLPLFTFAVDNSIEILAATLHKSSSPVKDQYDWVYTFFTIHEIKRKNGIWSSEGLKGYDHGYVPNVVAQMKTSGLQFQNFSGHKCVDDDNELEFALSAVDVVQVGQNAAEFHTTKELAAIVVRLQRKTTGNPGIDGRLSNNCVNEIRNPNLGDLLQDGTCVSQNVSSTTVILPGGVHTVPSNRSISTLIQRWKSGGSCDCGGWDLGCQLRTYTNHVEFRKKCSSEKNARDEFKLFTQVAQENQPVLRLAPFKDRIYSVEFNGSISLLQAFAICVAVLECGRPSGLLGPGKTYEEGTPGLIIPKGPVQTKETSQT